MRPIIAGYGEIGKAVGTIVGEHDIIDDGYLMPGNADVLLVCFPYSKTFVADVINYVIRHSIKHVAIFSTLPIGVTKEITGAIHSPVEGKHPDLEMSIRQMERWIGYNDREEGLFFNGYFKDLGLKTKMVENTDCTEALKLLSTTEYGINIVFAAYKAKVAEAIGMDFELTKEWNRAYNRLYKDLGMEKRYQKYVLDAPKGKIGGHCVRENTYLLQDQFPDNILTMIQDLDI